MALAGYIKRMEDIMRSDAGIDGTAQRLSQIVWLLFLKIFDDKEQEREAQALFGDEYTPVIPVGYRWRDWADCPDGKSLTGDDLIKFVNNELFPVLKGEIDIEGSSFKYDTRPDALLVKAVMDKAFNYAKDGVQLRLLIDKVFNNLQFETNSDKHELNGLYEDMLKSLQSAGRAGEFYTPRALTSFAISHVYPKVGDTVADFACGTGGFLADAYLNLQGQLQGEGQISKLVAVQDALYGVEWKPLPYMLCVTNLLLKGVPIPNIQNEDAFTHECDKDTKFDIIAMNPPYGGVASDFAKGKFGKDVQSSETFDLFMNLILKRLANNGRAVVILPDGFMFGDGVKATIKRNLMTQCNLHTIIRLPQSVFSPYTSITTNMLFFDKTGSTAETWFYRMDMPEGYKHFSKTKPILPKHFDVVNEWWNNRQEIIDDKGFPKAKKYSFAEIEQNNFNLDLCGYPTETREVLSPEDTIQSYKENRMIMNTKVDEILADICHALGIGD